MPRAPKKCGRSDCTQRVVGRTYCDQHQAEADRRANTAARGYGRQHRVTSEQARAKMADGTPCTRCGEPMYRTQRLVLDHNDERTGYLGLAHLTCNSRAGALAKTTRGGTPPPPF